MSVDCIVGIDPGVAGGISIWKPNEALKVVKMPKELMDLKVLFAELKNSSNQVLVFVEKVQLRPDDMEGGKAFRVQKMLNGFQRLKDVIEFSEVPFIQVHPMSWQSYLRLRQKGEDKKDRKNRYKTYAQEKYPEVKATLWNCDATLLVHFARKKMQNDINWLYENLPKSLHHILAHF